MVLSEDAGMLLSSVCANAADTRSLQVLLLVDSKDSKDPSPVHRGMQNSSTEAGEEPAG